MTRTPYAERVDSINASVERQRHESAKSEAHSPSGRVKRDLAAGMRFWWQVSQGFHWIWMHLLKPLVRPLKWLYERFWEFIRWSWERTVYKADEFGKRTFIKWRAGAFIVAYVAFFWFAALPLLACVRDMALYATTAHRNEVIYLTKSQEILPLENIHAVIGCHAMPCHEENSVYFRVHPRLFNQLWSLTHHSWAGGPPFHFPDYVAAAVPPGINRCVATSYGIRIKFFMRNLEWYPELLSASCGGQ